MQSLDSVIGKGSCNKVWWWHLQPVHGCAILLASKKLLDKNEEGLITPHLKNSRDSLTCLLQDCLSIPRLSRTVNGKVAGNITNIFCHSVTCLGTDQCCLGRNHKPGWFMNVPQYLLVKGFKQAFPIYTCNLHVAVPCWLHPKNS